MRRPAVATVCVALLLASSATGSKPAALGLRTIRDITLPGGTSRFDYVSLDATRH